MRISVSFWKWDRDSVVVIKLTSCSCESSCRVVGFGCGASVGASGSSHCGSWWLLCPRDLAEWLEGQRGRASVHQLLVLLAKTQCVWGLWLWKKMEVADKVSVSASYEGAFSRKVSSLEPMPSYWWVIDISSHIQLSLFIKICLLLSPASLFACCGLEFCQTLWKLKDCTHWCDSLSVTWVITLLYEIQAAGTAVSELTLQLDDTKLAADDGTFE